MNTEDKSKKDSIKNEETINEVEKELAVSQQFLRKVHFEEQEKRRIISKKLADFHQITEAIEPQISEKMKEKYLSDGKNMLDNIRKIKIKLNQK